MILIDNENITDATVNLALEEFCVRNLDMSNDYILFYINSPSVIIGKHQNTIEEINSDFTEENDIRVVRRISGGGAVYHDQGNLNFSFITKYSHSHIHNFRLFTEPVIKTLNELQVKAELNGRNDITVDGKKISGNAQFTDTKSMFSHGTLLFNTNLENVVKALNVKSGKIESKGIKSVKSRVANISDYLTNEMNIENFKEKIIDSIFKNENSPKIYHLNDAEWQKVHNLSESKYRAWEWNYGRSPEFNIQKIKRFDFGEIDARINVKDGIIKNVKFYGDFLGSFDLSGLEDQLLNIRYEKKSVSETLIDAELNKYFGRLELTEFVDFFVD